MNTHYLDELLEILCQQGCRKVNKILQQLEHNQRPDELSRYSTAECAYLHNELAQVMAVYDNNCCDI
jgi:hypothetical protein